MNTSITNRSLLATNTDVFQRYYIAFSGCLLWSLLLLNPLQIRAQTTFSALNDVCEDAGLQTDLGVVSPTGGTFKGPNVTDGGNGSTFTFDPAAAGVGTASIAYELIEQVGLDIDGEAAGDQSGSAVSVSSDGTRVAIGAPFNSGNGSLSGHVRIYDFDGTSWVQVGADIDSEAQGDQFGTSVSLSSDGTRVAIGAIDNDGNGFNAGHVRIFELSGASWVQIGADIDGEMGGDPNINFGADADQSGRSVILSSDGSRVAIGSIGNGDGAGHVRIYDFDGTSWNQVGSDIDGEAQGDNSGRSISMSSDGNRIAIGANANDGNGNSSGHVRIYDFDGTNWVQIIEIDGENNGDGSGSSVSLSANGRRIAIGANGSDGNGSISGHVRVFELAGNFLIKFGDDIDGEASTDFSGGSIALSSDGNRVVIGATGNDGNGNSSGHVRIYDFNFATGSWVQFGRDVDGEAAGDFSGRSVAISSDASFIVVGAESNDDNGNNSGHVRVFELSSAMAQIEVLPSDDAACSVLPVEWRSFSATAGAKQVVLQWETTHEPANAGFHIERSSGSLQWTVLTEQSPLPNNRYDYIDDAPLAGDNYYRIRQTDFDGTVSYSPVEAVTFTEAARISVFPNPVTDAFTVLLPSAFGENATLSMFDATGRLMSLQTRETSAGTRVEAGHLLPGLYLLKATSQDGKVRETVRVVR